MNYRKFPKIDDCDISCIGFGLMRLPLVKGTSEIDVEKTRQLVKTAVDQGINYFDTAYPYHKGKSESVFGQIVKEENLRDKIYIADKMPMWYVEKEEDLDRVLNEQLEKLQTDHIDFYLLHALNKERWEKAKRLHMTDFLERAKKEGKIRHIGFSFHDNFSVFKKIIDEYEGFEFCQIQYNYIDEDTEKLTDNPGWQAIKYAGKKNLGVIVMEPLRGGLLANPPVSVRNVFSSSDVPRLPVEWAFRFVWENQEVVTALSGMNEMDQVLVNSALASTAYPNSLPESQMDVIRKAQEVFAKKIMVPCTGCGYCMPCPNGVSIPDIFKMYNDASMRGLLEESGKTVLLDYKKLVDEGHGASVCVNCKACVTKCPQHIEIPEKLAEAHKVLL